MSTAVTTTPTRRSGRDRWLLITTVALSLFGVVMISSASAINSYITTQGASNAYYLVHQLMSLGVALVALLVGQGIPYTAWRKLALPAFVITTSMMVLVLFTGFGQKYGTFARSWLYLPGLPNIQPAEFAKVALVLYLAAYMTRQGEGKVATFQQGFIPFALISGVTIALTMAQPDLGTALIMAITAASIYFVSGASLTHVLAGILATGAGAWVILQRSTRVFNRVLAFLNPAIDPLGIGYQIQQALIAVGSGGFVGRGYGASRQKFDYLPEAQGDSIFAVISEELGFLRTWPIVVGGFLLIAWRGFRIAERSADPFARALAVGITTWICAQAFINITVILALFPTTGVPMPFISYGGSSLVACCFAMGILINISGYEDTPRHPDRWGHGWARRARAGRGPLFRSRTI